MSDDVWKMQGCFVHAACRFMHLNVLTMWSLGFRVLEIRVLHYVILNDVHFLKDHHTSLLPSGDHHLQTFDRVGICVNNLLHSIMHYTAL